MTDGQLLDMWRFEERFPFMGWDFSHLDDRWSEDELPWNYDEIVRCVLSPDKKLLDMDTGGGEFILSLGHPYENTWVTESYEPNYDICLNELAPLGVDVVHVHSSEDGLPYGDSCFDLIINRHGGYCPDEVYRCLKPGGLFITEQVGARNNMQLSRRLIPDYSPEFPLHDLSHECERFIRAGFRVIDRVEAFPKLRFFDIGALVYYAGIIEWEFPGFSVDRCAKELLSLQKELQENGFIPSLQHRFLIVAKK